MDLKKRVEISNHNLVNADNRFVFVLAEKKMNVSINLPKPCKCKNVFTNEIIENASVVCVSLDEGRCVFLKYLSDKE